MCEIEIKEKEHGTIRTAYYSKEKVEILRKHTKCEGRMRFAFFRDEEQDIWRGILLPELRKSILWENIKYGQAVGKSNTDYFEKFLKSKYSGLVENEEICECSRIGSLIADSVYASHNSQFEKCIFLCIWSLVDEIAKIQRKCRKIEGAISGDKLMPTLSGTCYKDMWGACDVRFGNIEIEDFRSKLTALELAVLERLYNKEMLIERNENPFFLKIVLPVNESRKEKAYKYYGEDYVRSYWGRENIRE